MKLCRVEVWFGEHLIIDHTDEETAAFAYEQAMRRRFASLRVTNEPVAPTEELATR